jgi:hypothetical protein
MEVGVEFYDDGGGGVAWKGGGGFAEREGWGGGEGVVWGRADGPIMKYGFPIRGSAAFQRGLLSLVELFQQGPYF